MIYAKILVDNMSEYDYLFKVIVVGDGAVGKTAITIRFAEGRFEEHYKMTIGVDFAIKLLEIGGYKVKLQVWDTGGQERFSYIRPLYYKGAMAALAIFDLTNRESFDNLPKWFQEVAENCGAIPLMLVGNKADLPDRAVTTEEGQSLSDKLGIMYYEASAKSGDNINLMFEKLGERLLGGRITTAPSTPISASLPTSPATPPSPPQVNFPSPPSLPVSAPPTSPLISAPPKAPAISSPPKFSPQPTIVRPPSPFKTISPPPSPPSTTPTFSSAPPTISKPPSTPKPAIFSNKPISFTEEDNVSSLDEALEILEVSEVENSAESEEEPIVEIPSFSSPPPTRTPEPIELEPINLEPTTPPSFTSAPPTLGAFQPAMPELEPIDLEPPVPESIDLTATFSSSEPEFSPGPPSPSEFVPFIAGPVQDTPKPVSSEPTGTWMDFLKKEVVEEEKPTIVPFLLSDYESKPDKVTEKIETPAEVMLEVIPDQKESKKEKKKREKEEKKAKKEDKKEKPASEGTVCPACHKTVPGGWRFCTYCGQSL